MCYVEYTIRQGDTLVGIARAHGMTEEELLHYDGGTGASNAERIQGGDSDGLDPGEVIVVPRAERRRLGGRSGPHTNTYVLPAPPSAPSPVTVTLHITEIAGLYRPGHDDGAGKRSGYQEGYKSEDDEGRVFINHIPRTDPAIDWQDTWRRDTQYVELQVELRPDTVTLPDDVYVVWTWEDPDDPSNESMREDAGQYVDPADVDIGGYQGPTENDNRGQCDYPRPGSGTEPAFEQIDAYTLRTVAETPTCETLVVDRLSRVRFHGTNVGGDNFRVQVSLKDHALVTAQGGDETGIMTMWKRIDVEYRKMASANALPVDDVPPYFEPARVQIDFTDALPAEEQEYLSEREAQRGRACSQLVRAPQDGGLFEHASQPGWFLLVAALGSSRENHTVTRNTLFDSRTGGRGYIVATDEGGVERWEAVVVPADIADDAHYVLFKETGDRKVGMGIWSKERHVPQRGYTTLHLMGIDYQSDFEPGDGRIGEPGQGGAYHRSTEYYPGHKLVRPANHWVAGGMRFPASGSSQRIEVDVEVWAIAEPTAGVSPHNRGFFAGRTIIFTKVEQDRIAAREAERDTARNAGDVARAAELDAELAEIRNNLPAKYQTSIVHELTHAFGFPHKCGYYTFENPAAKSCAMNYYNTWLYEVEAGAMYTVQAGDGSLERIAIQNGLDSWREIYHHPRNAAHRALRTNPNELHPGDTFWLPSRQVQRFETGETGQHLCAKHLDGIRRVHLEDNPRLWRT